MLKYALAYISHSHEYTWSTHSIPSNTLGYTPALVMGFFALPDLRTDSLIVFVEYRRLKKYWSQGIVTWLSVLHLGQNCTVFRKEWNILHISGGGHEEKWGFWRDYKSMLAFRTSELTLHCWALLGKMYEFTHFAINKRTETSPVRAKAQDTARADDPHIPWLGTNPSNPWCTEIKMMLWQGTKAQAYFHQGKILTSFDLQKWRWSSYARAKSKPQRSTKGPSTLTRDKSTIPLYTGTSTKVKCEGQNPNILSSRTYPLILPCTLRWRFHARVTGRPYLHQGPI